MASARSSAPHNAVPQVDEFRDAVPATLEERAAAALAARENRSELAPTGVSDAACAPDQAPLEVFDGEHATDSVALRNWFAHAVHAAYGQRNVRTLHVA